MSDSDSDDDSIRSPGDDEFLQINGIPIYFNEDWDIGIGGGLWTTGEIPRYDGKDIVWLVMYILMFLSILYDLYSYLNYKPDLYCH